MGLNRLALYEQTKQGYRRHCRERGKNHDAKELARRYRKAVVQVQVLRIAEGREHAAEVRRHRLEGERVRHFVLLSGGVKRAVPERQEREQRHVVGNQHRGKIGNRHQRGDERTRRAKTLYQFVRERAKHVLPFHCGDDRRHSEQRRQRSQIEIADVLPVGRHEAARNRRRDERDYKHDIVPQKRRDIVHPRYGIKLFFVRIHATPIITPRRAIRKRPRAKINKKSGSRDKVPHASAFFSCYFLFGFFQS